MSRPQENFQFSSSTSDDCDAEIIREWDNGTHLAAGWMGVKHSVTVCMVRWQYCICSLFDALTMAPFYQGEAHLEPSTAILQGAGAHFGLTRPCFYVISRE